MPRPDLLTIRKQIRSRLRQENEAGLQRLRRLYANHAGTLALIEEEYQNLNKQQPRPAKRISTH